MTVAGPEPRAHATDSNSRSARYTTPGLDLGVAQQLVGVLQHRLNALIDLSLTLKHVHWNVVGPHFISVHTMLNPQVAAVRTMVDETAERIATLGGSPFGTPGRLVAQRDWDDYSLGRADALAHLGALDVVYTDLLAAHRAAIKQTGELDPVTQDLLIEHARGLELFHWFIRSHLANAQGDLSTSGAVSERDAARRSTASQ